MPIVLRKLMLNVDSIQLKTKELLTFHCGCHGSLVTIATRYCLVLIILKKHHAENKVNMT